MKNAYENQIIDFFKSYFFEQEAVKIYRISRGGYIYIKTILNIIVCISYDFIEDELALCIERDITKFQDTPIPLHLMEQPIKNKIYKNAYLNISKNKRLSHPSKSKIANYLLLFEQYMQEKYSNP